MTTDHTRAPWPAPTPPTRSLAWAAPTCETPNRLPDGTRVRTPNGSTGVIEGRDGNEYEVFSAADGITYLLSDRDLTKSKRRLRPPAKPRAPRRPRKVKPAPTTPGYLGAAKGLSFRKRMGIDPKRPRVNAAPKPAPKVATRKANAGNQPGHFKGRLGVKWRRKPSARRALRVLDRRRLLAFGTSLLGYDITKLMDPPKRSNGKAHSAKCRAGRKGAKGGPGFIKADPRCPACKAQKRGKR